MKLIRRTIKELYIFWKLCWFLVILLLAAFFLYFWNRQDSEVILWCSLSYISSFVFYVVTSYIPDRKNHQNIHRVIVPYLQSILTDTRGVSYAFLAATQVKCDIKKLTEGDLHKIFEGIHPLDKSTRLEFLGFVNWLEYLQNQKNRVKRTVDRILTYEHYLDTDFILILESIHNSQLFEALDFIENKPVQFENLGFLADAYYQCYLQVGRLEGYMTKYMADI